MNDIYKNQNEKDILMLQYSQRKHYEMAENIEYIIWFFMFVNIIINNNHSINNFLGDYTVKIISTFLAILYIWMKFAINRNIQIGAYTKQFIDCMLFNFNIKKSPTKFTKAKIYEFAVAKKEKKNNEYLCQISNTGKDNPRGVKDWYENRENMDLSSAIYGCQKENLWWDERLSNLYMKIYTVISACIIITILCINREQTVISLIFSVIIPSLQIIIEVGYKYHYFVKLRIYRGKIEMKCKEIEKNLNNINEELLEELQELILERRLYKFLVPNKLHSVLSEKFHKLREFCCN